MSTNLSTKSKRRCINGEVIGSSPGKWLSCFLLEERWHIKNETACTLFSTSSPYLMFSDCCYGNRQYITTSLWYTVKTSWIVLCCLLAPPIPVRWWSCWVQTSCWSTKSFWFCCRTMLWRWEVTTTTDRDPPRRMNLSQFLNENSVFQCNLENVHFLVFYCIFWLVL